MWPIRSLIKWFYPGFDIQLHTESLFACQNLVCYCFCFDQLCYYSVASYSDGGARYLDENENSQFCTKWQKEFWEGIKLIDISAWYDTCLDFQINGNIEAFEAPKVMAFLLKIYFKLSPNARPVECGSTKYAM